MMTLAADEEVSPMVLATLAIGSLLLIAYGVILNASLWPLVSPVAMYFAFAFGAGENDKDSESTHSTDSEPIFQTNQSLDSEKLP